METLKSEVAALNKHESGIQNELKVSSDIQSKIQQKVNALKTKNKSKSTAIIDLCSNCDHVEYCALRSSEHFVFQCEHYS